MIVKFSALDRYWELTCDFEIWQQGYSAFSYCKAEAANVIAYIHNQESHHRKRSFLEEYRGFLEEFEIDYDEQYIFKELE